MKKQTVSAITLTVINLLLLSLSFFMGPIYTWFKAMVAANYTHLYYHLFSLVLVLFVVLAFIAVKLKPSRRFKACLCAGTAVIGVVLYIFVCRRLLTVEFFGVTGSLFYSRHALVLLTASEAAAAVTAVYEK